MIQGRVANDELRSHCKDTTNSVNNIERILDSVREDITAIAQNLKKIIAFLQDETHGVFEKFRDIQTSISRNTNRIHKVDSQFSPLIARLQRFGISICHIHRQRLFR
jgi:ABC-type transporter Mla subunit MlaD